MPLSFQVSRRDWPNAGSGARCLFAGYFSPWVLLLCSGLALMVSGWLLTSRAADPAMVHRLPAGMQQETADNAVDLDSLASAETSKDTRSSGDANAAPLAPPSLSSLEVLGRSIAFDRQMKENLDRMEGLSSDDQRELLRKLQRFQTLSLPEREQMQRFHDQLSRHPNRQQLQLVLDQYQDWLLTLPDRDRAILRAASPDERIAKIRELKLEQYEKSLGSDDASRLSKEDAHVLMDWLKTVRRSMGGGPMGFRRPPADDPAEEEARSAAKEASLAALYEKLSPAAQKLMDDAKSLPSRNGDPRDVLVFNWVRQVLFQPGDAALSETYDAATEEEKKQIQNIVELDPENLRSELTRLYRDKQGFARPSGRPGGGGPGGGPGNGGPGGGGRRGERRDDPGPPPGSGN